MRIGIDLGGTKIEALAIDEKGRELFRKRISTPRGDYAGTLAAVRGLVQNAEAVLKTKADSVGIGLPGSISPRTGLVQNANSVCLIGKPVDKDLAALLSRPLRLANDADCFALSEAFDGAAAGKRTVFGVILGTGVGGGIIVDGKPLCGPNAIAGEWGHNSLPWPKDDERPGPDCYCGAKGCIETFLSGPGLARDHGGGLEAIVIAQSSDASCKAALERYAERLARALASVINILDPDAVVLGGGMSNVDFLYERVPELWKSFVFTRNPVTPLLKARYGDSSGVRGAAWL